ncbi:hypothetical protein EON80_18815 [bacterium]|nr:MAG: hypothetical protein EON80_18815 [bacterium]
MEDEQSKPREAADFFLITAPEYDAVERAAAEGSSGRNWTTGIEAILHQAPGSNHQVRLNLTAEEQLAGLTPEILETLARKQDSDGVFALLYTTRLLAPPLGQGIGEPRSVVVDIDDVMEKIGLTARSTADRLEKRRRVYQYLIFGARAEVHGQRRGTYKNKVTGEVIETVLETALWYMLDKEWPAQKALFPDSEEVPVRVEMILSREWSKLLSSPQTAQYLPMGELLGSIPPGKPSGAWARIIGLALANFWRRNRRQVLDGTLRPKRRDLLDKYPPATGPVDEILESDKPHRAIEYWCGAMNILQEQNFIEKSGEALVTATATKVRLGRQGWVDRWLDERIDIKPSGQLREVMLGFSLPAEIKATPKRGRPKKQK